MLEVVQPSSSATTCGNYKTENVAAKAFDAVIEKTKCFTIEREVKGRHIIALKAGESIQKKFRIDRLLIPNERFINHGWRSGPIGVELKKSNTKIGGPISQIWDYKSSVFLSRTLGYARVLPTYILLFPMGRLHGDIASILAQNQMGGLSHENGPYFNRVIARLGEVTLFEINLNDGTIDIKNYALKVGAKNGSR